MINAYFSPVFYVLHIMNNPQSEVCIKYHEHIWIVFEWKCNSIFICALQEEKASLLHRTQEERRKREVK